ncbi:2-oxoacid:acceptor oxidoreductase family protein [Salipaludibacillus aurantiacus]|uniref:2-oxoglutarate ferredoxin oxidoreductase subunit gamma n=1 Tax=Salipaludibacillus aurantiacus TaxID=1601833 RepID=A0A1H9PAY1_9BACI|nr:2-oxoacid:acceptor oxidoreductase family protein [Salipaludibacillus aurantiacus]SER45301.1 2-oxoglutarate ferredoxin oxidoreductase subunit gamma [Salipaludibacillus aurantiacus]
MKQELIIAGFGGQGVMSMGQLLAYAAMKEGKEVSWLPSYGPEQRGGTANVSVVISDSKFGSPVIDRPTSLIALNNPSFLKFEPLVKEGGDIFINEDLVTVQSGRKDVTVHLIPALTVANELNEQRTAGMVILGAFITKTGILKTESLLAALTYLLGKKKDHLIPVNRQAIVRGEKIIKKALSSIN